MIRREEIMIRAATTEIEFFLIKKISENKSWFLKKINKINKLLVRLTKKK